MLKTWDWVLLIGGSLMLAFLSLVTPVYAETEPYVDEACAQSFACQSEIIWELILIPSDEVVSFGDMDEAECEELKQEVEPYTQPFTAVKCRPRLVSRERV